MGRLARQNLFHRKARFAVTRRGIVSALAEAAAREEDRARAAAVAGAKVELAEARATLEMSGSSTLTGPPKPVATTSLAAWRFGSAASSAEEPWLNRPRTRTAGLWRRGLRCTRVSRCRGSFEWTRARFRRVGQCLYMGTSDIAIFGHLPLYGHSRLAYCLPRV